jgi:hypothetical protein
VRAWSGCLRHEKDHQARGLDFQEIRPKNYFSFSGNKPCVRAVWKNEHVKTL